MPALRLTAKLRGQTAEEQACHFLEQQGLTLLTKNYRCPRGEIDLVMQHGDMVVFIEVRYRKNNRYGSGAESVDFRKQARITATAMHYLQAHPKQALLPARFDVIAMSANETPQWIENAFTAS